MIHKRTLTNEKKCLYCNFLADKFELTTKNYTINWKLEGAKGYCGLLLL